MAFIFLGQCGFCQGKIGQRHQKNQGFTGCNKKTGKR